MKRFFVAAFCTLMMSGSLLAQDAATIAAPVAPGEDVAVEVVAQDVAPVADAIITDDVAIEGSVMEGTFVSNPGYFQEGIVANPGCSGCGNNVVAPSYSPMANTFVAAPIQGCTSCGTNVVAPNYSPMARTFVRAPRRQGCSSCGTSVAAPMYSPMVNTYAAAPIQASGCCGQVAAPMMAAPMMAAPMMAASPCCDAAPVAECCDPCQRSRPQVVRTVTSRSRGALTRVRGRRSNSCCN